MGLQAPVEQVDIVDGRGRQLTASREGSGRKRVEVKVTSDLGKPVRGRDGVVGWVSDYGAVSKKVSGKVIVDYCFTTFFVAGFNLTTASIIFTIATISLLG